MTRSFTGSLSAVSALLVLLGSACDDAAVDRRSDPLLVQFEQAWRIDGDAGSSQDDSGVPPDLHPDAGAPPATKPGGAPSDAATHFALGTTVFTSYPGLAGNVLSHGILPLPADGAQIASLKDLADTSKLTVSMTLPLVQGTVQTGNAFGADLHHTGGLTFAAVAAGLSITLSNFDVVIKTQPTLGGYVAVNIDNNPFEVVRLFEIDPATIKPQFVTARDVLLQDLAYILTTDGAAKLNATLKTDAFKVGEQCATADTTLRLL